MNEFQLSIFDKVLVPMQFDDESQPSYDYPKLSYKSTLTQDANRFLDLLGSAGNSIRSKINDTL